MQQPISKLVFLNARAMPRDTGMITINSHQSDKLKRVLRYVKLHGPQAGLDAKCLPQMFLSSVSPVHCRIAPLNLDAGGLNTCSRALVGLLVPLDGASLVSVRPSTLGSYPISPNLEACPNSRQILRRTSHHVSRLAPDAELFQIVAQIHRRRVSQAPQETPSRVSSGQFDRRR